MKFIQKTLSLGSPGGIIAILIAVPVTLLLLSQWDKARALMGLATKGRIPV
ncbi:MAG: hypothetical protein U9N14_05555 [Pseudomonadota bacterium]|nr:hypothetical protein [Pseudomonadota bacterium]